MFPGESAEQDGGVRALLGRECPFYRAVKMLRLVESRDFAQAGSFCFEALLDFGIILNLDEIRRHILLRRWKVLRDCFEGLQAEHRFVTLRVRSWQEHSKAEEGKTYPPHECRNCSGTALRLQRIWLRALDRAAY
jgi:hypothetical protein